MSSCDHKKAKIDMRMCKFVSDVPCWSPKWRIIDFSMFHQTRRPRTRSHGRDWFGIRGVHFWFVSVSVLYWEIYRLIETIVRRNTSRSYQNAIKALHSWLTWSLSLVTMYHSWRWRLFCYAFVVWLVWARNWRTWKHLCQIHLYHAWLRRPKQQQCLRQYFRQYFRDWSFIFS